MSIDFSEFHPFSRRHIGPDESELRQMIDEIGSESLDEFIESVIPGALRTRRPLQLDNSLSEYDALQKLSTIASGNHVYRSLIGMGYYDTVTPAVIQRNILE